MPRFYSDEQKSEIVRLYQEGKSVAALAREMGITTTMAARTLSAAGVRDRTRVLSLPKDQQEELTRRYLSGEKVDDIAEAFNIAPSTVRSIAGKNGAEQRTRGAQQRRMSIEDQKKIVDMWNAGSSAAMIASEMDCSSQIVKRILNKHNIYINRRWTTGEKSSQWKGGRIRVNEGYIAVKVYPGEFGHEMANAMNYVPEHRLVMARSLGRPLRPSETVHHINGNPSDNRLDNLQLRQGRHGRGAVFFCNDCGSHNIGSRTLAEARAEYAALTTGETK